MAHHAEAYAPLVSAVTSRGYGAAYDPLATNCYLVLSIERHAHFSACRIVVLHVDGHWQIRMSDPSFSIETTHFEHFVTLCLAILESLEQQHAWFEMAQKFTVQHCFKPLSWPLLNFVETEYWSSYRSQFGWTAAKVSGRQVWHEFESGRKREQPGRVICLPDAFPEYSSSHKAWLRATEQRLSLALHDSLRECVSGGELIYAAEENIAYELDAQRLVRRPFCDYWAISAGPDINSIIFAPKDFRFTYFYDAATCTVQLWGTELLRHFKCPS